ncbi:hypothetical protein G4B88_008036 [Cannabis sativa]|uniref:DUF8039 domain-containing protein n=1 Tax=Cannabis sativa TaxID=3483 RepID=A0A7J6I9N6_CANSA|nr:hypothetical protein G4B88_008036 [Cannabis sativa]
MDYEDVSQCVKLCPDNIDNVVAEGVIIKAVDFFSYHGDIITNDYAQVQITQVIQGEAKIPYPKGAIRYVYDACNKLVPWPRELILTEEHWMLIIAMTSGRVVFLNPLKSKISSIIAEMIKTAYANISSNAIVFGTNGPQIWTFPCPKQPYNYECGYYVLTYIRDMLQHSNPITAIKAKFGGLSQYSKDDHLLPLRQQWLSQLLPLIYNN